MKKIFKLLSIAIFAGAILMSCEGPEGPPGENGIDASAECMVCHDAGTAYAAKVDQFNESAHSHGTYFSRQGDCSGCHSTEGFLARMDFTSVDEMFDLALTDQSAIGCKTCHNVHLAYDETDWSLTFTDQVTETILGTMSPLVASSSFEDKGSNNMCLQCHQSRDPENVPSITSTDDVGISHFWGPHHGVQGSISQSQGGVHIVGTSYPTGPFNPSTGFDHTCINCHMNNGDHSLAVDESACIQCHSDIEDKLADIQDEVETKLDILGKTLAGLGALTPDTESEWVWDDGLGEHIEIIDTVGYHAAGSGYGGYSPLDVPADHARAVFNYLIVAEDQSLGVHNPDYINALLDNTITSLAK